MPLKASLKLGTEATPDIKGTLARTREIGVTSASHEVGSGVDVETGKVSSGRRHKLFTITKDVDCATPHLREAHKGNKPFTTFRLNLFHTPAFGKDCAHHTVLLTGARICSYRTVMPRALAATATVHEYEEISFAYDSIAFVVNKQEADAPHGNNALQAKEVGVSFPPDWVEAKIRAVAKDNAGKIAGEVKDKLWKEWKKSHPDAGE